MAIRRSSSADVEGLLEELHQASGDERRLEGTFARLAVIGPRAVSHILRAFESAREPAHRAALLLSLERIPDARTAAVVVTALGSGGAVAPPNLIVRFAAIRAARALLEISPEGTVVLERLTTIVLDGQEPTDIRRAAFGALADLPPATLRPLKTRLAKDSNEAMRVLAKARRDRPTGDSVADLAALRSHLPENADVVLDALQRTGGDAPLSTLHTLLKSVREAEMAGGRKRADWSAVRGAIHLALARRESRVALYDLREALENSDHHPLPPDFLRAVELAADATCLEPLARAWMHATGDAHKTPAADWGRQLRQAFRGVLARQRPSDRKKLLTRIRQRWNEREQGQRLSELLDS